jgi:hypothetical protein
MELRSAGRVIASIAQARRTEHAERLLQHSFDLVIVDEAHHLRHRLSHGPSSNLRSVVNAVDSE